MFKLKGYTHGSNRLKMVDNVIVPHDIQKCSKCLIDKPIDQFQRRKTVIHRVYSWCKKCVNANTNEWRKTKGGRDKERNLHLTKSFNITIEQYNAIAASQDNKCAICNQLESYITPKMNKPASLAVDHCHKTGKIRALLCRRCNQVLGQFNDDISAFQRVIDYLNKHKE